LLRTSVMLDGAPVIEHFVTGFDEQQIALRRDFRDVQAPPLLEMRLGELVRLAGMEVFLRPGVRVQAYMRSDRRIDEHRTAALALDEIRGVEAAERGTDVANAGCVHAVYLLANDAQRIVGLRRQRRADEFVGES